MLRKVPVSPWQTMKVANSGATSLDLSKPVEDETFCGPICQHPSCWESKQRMEKGFPHYCRMTRSLSEPLETDLPNMTMYNLLEDYGYDPNDRYPVRFDGHWLYQSASDKDTSLSARQRKLPQPTPRNDSVSVDRVPELHVVEVQEVFDIDDLNNRWDETFLTKQCYMWVPNPSRTPRVTRASESPPPLSIEDSFKQQPVLVKDHTEEMMPQEIERHREETKVFAELPVIKKKSCHGPSLARPRAQMKTPLTGKPRVDTEGLKDLLNLPRDVLMQVLDHLKQSDFTSKEKVRSVIQQVRPPVEPVVAKGHLSPIAPVFVQQQKVKLLHGKTRNVRQPSVITQPVFQLDNEDKPSDNLQVKGMAKVKDIEVDLTKDVYTSSEIGTQDAYSLQGFSKYRKALPEIGATAYSESGGSPRLRHKIPSISLGLPELPFGVSQIRPFTYKNQQYLDLSIGPVPSPPSTSRSTEFDGSDHGTTVRPNIPSASTRVDITGVVYDPQYKPKSAKGALQTRSPVRSSRMQKSPLRMVTSRQSLSRSGRLRTDKTREISMSPVPKFQAPANSPNQSPATSPTPHVLAIIPGLNELTTDLSAAERDQKLTRQAGPTAPTSSMYTPDMLPAYHQTDGTKRFANNVPQPSFNMAENTSIVNEDIPITNKVCRKKMSHKSKQHEANKKHRHHQEIERMNICLVEDPRPTVIVKRHSLVRDAIPVTSNVINNRTYDLEQREINEEQRACQEIERRNNYEIENPHPTVIVKRHSLVRDVIPVNKEAMDDMVFDLEVDKTTEDHSACQEIERTNSFEIEDPHPTIIVRRQGVVHDSIPVMIEATKNKRTHRKHKDEKREQKVYQEIERKKSFESEDPHSSMIDRRHSDAHQSTSRTSEAPKSKTAYKRQEPTREIERKDSFETEESQPSVSVRRPRAAPDSTPRRHSAYQEIEKRRSSSESEEQQPTVSPRRRIAFNKSVKGMKDAAYDTERRIHFETEDPHTPGTDRRLSYPHEPISRRTEVMKRRTLYDKQKEPIRGHRSYKEIERENRFETEAPLPTITDRRHNHDRDSRTQESYTGYEEIDFQTEDLYRTVVARRYNAMRNSTPARNDARMNNRELDSEQEIETTNEFVIENPTIITRK